MNELTSDVSGSDLPDDGRGSAVSVRGLSKTYGDGEAGVTAVDDVSFDIERGEIVGILGPNGAGKTTTIKSCLGLLIPTAGTVEIGGIDIHDSTPAAYRHVSAVLEGARNVYWRLTVRENLDFFARLQGIDPAAASEWHDELLRKLDLTDKDDEAVRNLSRGMKQKVALACALARRTPILFLDEPTLGLDVETSYDLRAELRRLTREEDKTVVLSSHDMDVVQDLCDRVIIMNDGEVVANDRVDELMSVFEQRAYEVVASGDVPTTVRSSVESSYEVTDWTRTGENTTFQILPEDGEDDLEDIVSALNASGLTPVSVSRVRPDLEEVFLEITERETQEVSA